MPLAVTHVLLSIVAIDIYRDYIIRNKHLIPLPFIFYGGVAGLLPDIDVPLTWLANTLGIQGDFHRLLTHSLFFPLVFLIIALLLIKSSNRKLPVLFGILTFGTAFHIMLDFIFTTPILPFYPLSHLGVGLNLFGIIGVPNIEAGLDAFILLGWLWHEEKRHKISDFI